MQVTYSNKARLEEALEKVSKSGRLENFIETEAEEIKGIEKLQITTEKLEKLEKLRITTEKAIEKEIISQSTTFRTAFSESTSQASTSTTTQREETTSQRESTTQREATTQRESTTPQTTKTTESQKPVEITTAKKELDRPASTSVRFPQDETSDEPTLLPNQIPVEVRSLPQKVPFGPQLPPQQQGAISFQDRPTDTILQVSRFLVVCPEVKTDNFTLCCRRRAWLGVVRQSGLAALHRSLRHVTGGRLWNHWNSICQPVKWSIFTRIP